MKNKTIGLNILLWGEIIISARILLFAIPVVMSRKMAGNVSCSIQDWFIVLLAIAAFFYFIVGVLSLTGNKLWKFLQYIVVALTLVITGSLIVMSLRTSSPLYFHYFLPAIVSLGLLVGILKLDAPVQTKS